jgi:hypothetical protein
MFNELSNNNSLMTDPRKHGLLLLVLFLQFSFLSPFAAHLFIGIECPIEDTFKHLNSCIIIKLFEWFAT